MTQKEIEKFLANTKVYVNGKSKEIQEKLFSFGYRWSIILSTEVHHETKPFLFIYKDKDITHTNDMRYFTEHKNREITAEEILALELTEPAYRPFKNAEECWEEMLKHGPFGWLIGSSKYHLISSISDVYIWFNNTVYYTFEEVFNTYKFADGTPFGIKEE